jgi:primosomal protein N' (replication factor Y) (superfamily II helicase)
MSEYCDVAFNLPVPQVFAYACAAFPGCVAGCRVTAPFGARKLQGFVVAVSDNKPAGDFEIKPIARLVDKEPVFGERTLELASWISGLYLCSLGEALAMMVPGGKREMETEGAITFHDTEEFKIESLTGPQEQALNAIRAARAPLYYLYGVTGSGKTLVFLHAAKEVFERGRGVIYLVPEIALTHQVIGAFRQVFGAAVAEKELAVLHSGLTGSRRLTEWRRVLRGEARLVVGVRSAVFAPVADLGLIVLDEEHESTYKAGSTPRYHARQAAMHRAANEGALLLMGSATPSLEAWHGMKSGTMPYSTLAERAHGTAMPKVEIVGLKGDEGPLSQRLIREIEATKARGRQTILFLNRRGFSHFFTCRSCGFELKCRRCSVALTYHKARHKLVCHYCGYKTAPVTVCPECGSLDVGYLGFGTERVEEELRKLFPDYVVKRLDTDTVKEKRSMGETLAAFKAGNIDILLGTQMVAKGLNVRGLSLVGIVLADTSLLLPDFRAAERTFNLIVQVGGRAGRFDRDGKVLIQTFRASHDAVSCASRFALEEYYGRELAVRRELGFPPFARLIRLVFRGRDKNKTEASARSFAAACAGFLPAAGYAEAPAAERPSAEGPPVKQTHAEVLGPAECPLGLIAHNYRYQVIVRGREFGPLRHAVKAALSAQKAHGGVYIEVDVDPQSLL